MLKLRIALNNLLHAVGWAQWRMELQTVHVDDQEMQVATIVVTDKERMARLKYPEDEF